MKDSFSKRYTPKKLLREELDIDKKNQEVGRTYLETVKNRGDRPKGMRYFEEIVSDTKFVEKLKDEGKPIVGVLCNIVPREIISAAGAIPLRLCSGSPPAVEVGEGVLPRDVCPLVKSTMGMQIAQAKLHQVCDLLIIPATCDGKKKTASLLNAYLPTWVMEIPQDKDYLKNRDLWVKEVKSLIARLRKFTGNFAGKTELTKIIKEYRHQVDIAREFHSFRGGKPELLSEMDYLLVMQAAFILSPALWSEKVSQLLEDLKKQKSPANNKKRILLAGSPVIWPNYKIVQLLEESGAEIVADTLCSGTESLFNPAEVDEWTYAGMLRAIALKYLFPSICPCFVEGEDRIDRILELRQKFKIDGVIFHTLRLCTVFDIENQLIFKVLSEKGLPYLNIYTDYSQEDREQIRTRIEAFLEMLE